MNYPVALVCPDCKSRLESFSAKLRCRKCKKLYPVVNSIPRFVIDKKLDNKNKQVMDTFGFKWTRDAWGFKQKHIRLMDKWFQDRFGFKSTQAVKKFFAGTLVLDAGVGSGQNENHFGQYPRAIIGVDISQSVDAAYKHWNKRLPISLIQADIYKLPLEDNIFDIVISDGVLHHTPSTKKALVSISRKVKSGGYVMFYVYRKKGPIREFVDDEIRKRIAHLSNEDAWKALEPLTLFAKELSRQNIKIKITEDIPLLEMPKGKYDLQRFLYWHVMKFHWNEALNFDENNHVNFDWYRPFYAHRHTPDEIKKWLKELKLAPVHFNIGDSGISVIARKI
jgi:SAM-dependent methyltransferase